MFNKSLKLLELLWIDTSRGEVCNLSSAAIQKISACSFLYSPCVYTRNSELVFWIPRSSRQRNLTISQTTGNLKIAFVPAQLHTAVLEIWVRKHLSL